MTSTNQRPNILLITSDQHRADSLGCAGHPCIRTPHLDRLAFGGTRFTNAYSDCPVCIPARTTMITGIQSHRYGMPEYNAAHRIDRTREKFLGSLITRAGYQTHMVGKTHWHTEPSFRAGFEHVQRLDGLHRDILAKTGRAGDPSGIGANELYPGMSEYPPELYSTNWIVEQCLHFLDSREREQPFFLWASFIDPHPPNRIHEPYYSMYDNDPVPAPVMGDWAADDRCPLALYQQRWTFETGTMRPAELRKARGVYYGMISNLDHQLGRLLGKLVAQDQFNNTLIVYTSDHGEMLGDHRLFSKSNFLQGAGAIPMIVRPPNSMECERGRTSDALVELADLLPTFCDAAGVEAPADVTGRSMLPIVSGTAAKVRDELHGQIHVSHMFHTGDLKYLYFASDGSELLFDPTKDPFDEHDLSGDQAKLKSMRERFIAHLRSEGHSHLVDGQLLNRKQPRPPINQLRAPVEIMGWRATVWGSKETNSMAPRDRLPQNEKRKT